MQELAFLNGITIWHWFILGTALVVLEMLAPGVIFLWLGVAAIITGLILLAIPAMTWQIQFLVFAGFAVITVLAGRGWVKRHPTKSEQPNLNIRGAQYIGRNFTLSQGIDDGTGIIIIDDTRWKISGPDLTAGSKIRVTALDGQVLTVEATED